MLGEGANTSSVGNEEDLYRQRSKIYVFRSPSWQETGLGIARLLKDKETGQVRFRFEDEKSNLVVANHLVVDLSPYCQLTQPAGSQKIWNWIASDYSGEDKHLETFALKFGTPERARQFQEAFELAKALNSQACPELATLAGGDLSEEAAAEIVAAATHAKRDDGYQATGIKASVDISGTAAAQAKSAAKGASLFGGAGSATPGSVFGSASSTAVIGQGSSHEKKELELDAGAQEVRRSGTLSVQIIAGHNLVNVPAGGFFSGSAWSAPGTSTFVIAKFGSQEQKTEVIEGNLNPVWNADPFLFSLDAAVPEHKTLYLEVWDHKAHANVNIGKFQVDVSSLTAGTRQHYREALQDAKQGELEFGLLYTIGAPASAAMEAEVSEERGAAEEVQDEVHEHGISSSPAKEQAAQPTSSPWSGAAPTGLFAGTPSAGTFGAPSSGGGFFSSMVSSGGGFFSAPESAPAQSNPFSGMSLLSSSPASSGSSGGLWASATASAGSSGGFLAASSTAPSPFGGPAPENKDTAGEDDLVEEEEVVVVPGWTASVSLELLDTVETGEEHEQEIYVQRAKLLRFRDGDWKERGVGNVKLLKHKVTGMIRFMLRQEKTEKIVGNHYVHPQDPYCKLVQNAGSDKIWMWSAMEASDGEQKCESLACKFKDADLAQKFKEAFESARAENRQVMESGTAAVQSADAQAQEEQQEAAAVARDAKEELQAVTAQAEDNAAKEANMVKSLGGLGISAALAKEVQESVTSKEPAKTFHFKDSPKEGGEQEEKVLYCQRGKLYRFNKGEWLDRGLGDGKLLQHVQTGKVRFQLLQEHTEKLLSNHWVVADGDFCILKENPGTNKTLMWTAKECADNPSEPIAEKLAWKLKSLEQIQVFKEAFEKAKVINSSIFDKERPDAEAKAQETMAPSPAAPAEKEDKKSTDVANPFAVSGSLFGGNSTGTSLFGGGAASTAEQSPAVAPEAAKEDKEKPSLFANGSSKPSESPWAGPASGGLFSNTNGASSGGLFSGSMSTSGKLFTNTTPGGLFPKSAPTPAGSSGGLFTAAASSGSASSGGLFSAAASSGSASSGGLFSAAASSGSASSGGLFSAAASSGSASSGGLFSAAASSTSSGGLFSNAATTSSTSSGGLFSNAATTSSTSSGGLFSGSGGGGIFSSLASTSSGGASTGGLFSSVAPAQTGGLFSSAASSGSSSSSASSGGFFSSGVSTAGSSSPSPFAGLSSMFGSSPTTSATTGGGLFSSAAPAAAAGGLFSSAAPTESASSSGGLFSSAAPKAAASSSGGLFSSAAPATTSNAAAQEGAAQDEEYVEEEEVTHVPGWTPSVTLDVKDHIETGEEQEEVMYSQRAKLYRFKEGDWKERGLGDAKLLKHKETGKVRFMLRQEKTGKIVGNHYVIDHHPYCDLKPLAGSDKAWFWFARQDCSEEQPSDERFALRFRSPELAQEFKESFDQAKVLNSTALDLDGSGSSKAAQPAPVAKPVASPKIAAAASPKTAAAASPKIAAAASPKATPTPAPTTAPAPTPTTAPAAGGFFGNLFSSTSTASSGGGLFSSPTTSGGLFSSASSGSSGGLFSSPATSAGLFSSTSAASSGGSFSLGSAFSPASATPAAAQATTSTTTGNDAPEQQQGDDDRFVQEEEVTVVPGWTPSVTLDVKGDVETGEENEVQIYAQRSKLRRFKDKEWKERGTGEAKLLKNPKTGAVRFLLRQEKTLKIVANHIVINHDTYCVLKPNAGSDKIWVWTAMDCADSEQPVAEMFALQFANKEVGAKFKEAFDQAKTDPSPSAYEGAEAAPKPKSSPAPPGAVSKSSSGASPPPATPAAAPSTQPESPGKFHDWNSFQTSKFEAAAEEEGEEDDEDGEDDGQDYDDDVHQDVSAPTEPCKSLADMAAKQASSGWRCEVCRCIWSESEIECSVCEIPRPGCEEKAAEDAAKKEADMQGIAALFGGGSSANKATGFNTSASPGAPVSFGFGNGAQAKSGALFGGGAGSGLFGGSAASSGAGLFGNAQAQSAEPKPHVPVVVPPPAKPLFGGPSAGASLFGTAPASSGGIFFGAQAAAPPPPPPPPPPAETQSTGAGLFGGPPMAAATAKASSGAPLFGAAASAGAPLFGPPASSGALFGASASSGALFGSSASTGAPLFAAASSSGASSGSGLFGANASPKAPLFGGAAASSGASLFGGAAASSSGSLFGGSSASSGASLFGGSAPSSGAPLFGSRAVASSGASLFGSAAASSGAPLFGGAASPAGAPLFGSAATATAPAAPAAPTPAASVATAPAAAESASIEDSGVSDFLSWHMKREQAVAQAALQPKASQAVPTPPPPPPRQEVINEKPSLKEDVKHDGLIGGTLDWARDHVPGHGDQPAVMPAIEQTQKAMQQAQQAMAKVEELRTACLNAEERARRAEEAQGDLAKQIDMLRKYQAEEGAGLQQSIRQLKVQQQEGELQVNLKLSEAMRREEEEREKAARRQQSLEVSLTASQEKAASAMRVAEEARQVAQDAQLATQELSDLFKGQLEDFKLELEDFKSKEDNGNLEALRKMSVPDRIMYFQKLHKQKTQDKPSYLIGKENGGVEKEKLGLLGPPSFPLGGIPSNQSGLKQSWPLGQAPPAPGPLLRRLG